VGEREHPRTKNADLRAQSRECRGDHAEPRSGKEHGPINNSESPKPVDTKLGRCGEHFGTILGGLLPCERASDEALSRTTCERTNSTRTHENKPQNTSNFQEHTNDRLRWLTHCLPSLGLRSLPSSSSFLFLLFSLLLRLPCSCVFFSPFHRRVSPLLTNLVKTTVIERLRRPVLAPATRLACFPGHPIDRVSSTCVVVGVSAYMSERKCKNDKNEKGGGGGGGEGECDRIRNTRVQVHVWVCVCGCVWV
jgi:hypothetical protein